MAGQRRVIRAALGLKPGEDVLDIGSGPGFLASEMSAEVGPGGSVIGVDPSPSMLAIACGRPQAADSVPVEFSAGEATALPCAGDSFDAVTSTQVYEYVENVPAALAEAWRVLRPGGGPLVLDTDWDFDRLAVWRPRPDAACSPPGTGTWPILICRGGSPGCSKRPASQSPTGRRSHC